MKEIRRKSGENLSTAAKLLGENKTDRPKGLSETADGSHSPYSCLHRPQGVAGSQRGASRADRRYIWNTIMGMFQNFLPTES